MIKIHAENFRSFPVLDWEIPSGLTLIDGVNKDTGGSNMAGKTTLLDAWFWCRYGWLPKWKGPKGGSVDAVLRRKNNVVVGATLVRVTESFGSNVLEIQRERPNRLRVWKNGVEEKGVDQKALEGLIGSPDRFLVCVYLPQRRQRSFYWMGDNDRTELISIVAGLEDLERAAEAAKLERDEAKLHIEQSELTIKVYEQNIQALPARIKNLTIKRDESKSLLNIAEQQAHQAELILDQYNFDIEHQQKEEVSEKIDALVDQLADTQVSIQSLQGTYDAQKKNLENFAPLDPKYKESIEAAKKELKLAEELTAQIGQIQGQIILEKSLANEAEDGVCSQCDQLLPESKRKEKADKHLAKVEQLRKGLSQIKVPEIAGIKAKLEQAEGEYEEARAKTDKGPAIIQANLSEIRSKIDAKKAEERIIQRDIQAIKDEIKRKVEDKRVELRRAVETAYREVSHNKKILESAQENLDLIKDDETKLKAKITEEDDYIRHWKKELDRWLDLIEIFGPKGYRAVCYDGLIEKISDRAGQLLSVMTQGLYSTRLDQLGQDSKGNQKIVLRPVIIKGGSEVPLDDLSGGAEERVALAYDVAVAEAAGEGYPLLLDEVLSALDAVGKTEAMALLEEVSKSRPVLVIDHASEFKAMFSQVVRVIYEGEESRLEVA